MDIVLIIYYVYFYLFVCIKQEKEKQAVRRGNLKLLSWEQVKELRGQGVRYYKSKSHCMVRQPELELGFWTPACDFVDTCHVSY